MRRTRNKKFTGFRAFPTGVALVLTEVAFWIVIGLAWYGIRQIAPNVQWGHLNWGPLLLAIPASVALFIWSYNLKSKWAKRLADEHLWPNTLPHWRPRLLGWKFALWRLALVCAVFSIMDLKVGARLREVQSEGVDIMIALDVSNSMEAEDVGMSRLDLGKRTIERLVGQLDGDRVGLVVFAGDAYVQCPITTDYGAIKLFLSQVSTGLVPVQGTAVGRAMEVCRAGFDPESLASKMIVVLTDGENHEDDAVEIAKQIAGASIEIHTIGMGTVNGAPIPLYDRFGRSKGFKTDQEGQPIVTALDEATLIQIAETGRGTFIRAGQGLVNLNPIFDAMRSMEQQEVATLSYTDYTHLFQYFLAAALFLILIESLVGISFRKVLSKAKFSEL
ncbi:MAG: VWA domain-containing protein [Flavobacteriales bacterium]|nr:VWA domain-containing protein [Flavobacteriales bacterium]